MKTLFVAGDYDDNNGRNSKIAETIFRAMKLDNVDYRNGGHYNDLLMLYDRIDRYGLVFWLAKIPEDKPSVSAILKSRCNSFVFVSSKRNLEHRLTTFDIVHEALKIKSNLILEFGKQEGRYSARVLDPLGNVFLDYSGNMELVGKVLGKRAKELLGYTRMKSESIGDKITFPVPDEFLRVIKYHANSFSDFIYKNPEAVNRYMGNASFRCANGFPSFRKENLIFVSRRNVDKRGINSDSFVAVESGGENVRYFGVKKPSVDTPIQLKLYQNYRNVNFMLHSHNYVKDAVFTKKIIPCGALEEVEEITSLFPDKNLENFSVNLRGHGSIVGSKNLAQIWNIKYGQRALPEIHVNYLEEKYE
jgi:hypothetical protein